jgi:hypothetical protein
MTRLLCLNRPGGTSLSIILFMLQIARLHSLEHNHMDGSQNQHGGRNVPHSTPSQIDALGVRFGIRSHSELMAPLVAKYNPHLGSC